MGKKIKVGKSRRDKFYFLAKESGYRSRAAFKLLQLNRKFGFLQSSRVLLDLCAAPGGWLQIAKECMPISSMIFGVDLVPIPSISGVKTLIGDITTPEIRSALKKELKHFKVDCVLHDGAPNVGTSWAQDEFQQAQLCHQAFLLATDFLRKGGWFVTKIFRSADYEKVKFVLMQLFKSVKAAKPEASRLESAEIYLVCQGYRAPDKIDPAFFDLGKVFEDVKSTEEVTKASIMNQMFGSKTKKKKAEGYTEDDDKANSIPVSDLFAADEPLELLAKANSVHFDLEEIEKHPSTTPEIKACFKDIKVLGKPEIRTILQWRRKLLEKLQSSAKQLTDLAKAKEAAGDVEVKSIEVTENEALSKMDDLVDRVREEERKGIKKKMKKARDVKKKLVQRIQLNMVHKGDIMDQNEDIELFSLSAINNINQVSDVPVPEAAQMDEPEEEVPRKKVRFDMKDKLENIEEAAEQVEPRYKVQKPAVDDEDHEEMDYDDVPWSDEDDAEDGPQRDFKHSLITSLEDRQSQKKRRYESWFSQPAFAKLRQSEEEILFEKQWSDDEDKEEKKQLPINGVDLDVESDFSDFESALPTPAPTLTKSGNKVLPDTDTKVHDKSTAEKIEKLTTPAELAIATKIATSKKERRNIVEQGFHRFMFNDENLPRWFLEDERKHMRACTINLTKEELAPHEKRLRSVNVRTIKKVVEAKARKKMRRVKRAEKVRQKAENVLDQEGVATGEKLHEVKQLYKKSGVLSRGRKKKVVFSVARKSGATSTKGGRAPKGTVVKRVDPRMKKDKRSAAKKSAKGGKKSKQSFGGKNKKKGKKR